MEEKINLVKNVIISIDLVTYNALGKKITKPDDEYCLIMGRKMRCISTAGAEITVKIEGTISTNTIVFFVDTNNLENINYKEIEFICKISKKVDDSVIVLYNFIKENNGEIKDYIECV